MSYSIRLYKIKCLEESDESSDADEPYVLVTAADMRWSPVPGTTPNPIQQPTTFLYGEWENFDKDEELVLIGERPFWKIHQLPNDPPDEHPPAAQIANPNDVCFVVTVMEHDHGNLDAYRGAVQLAARASLGSSLGLPRPVRVTRLLDDIRSAVGLIDLPTFDDHVGTKEFRLDSSDD